KAAYGRTLADAGLGRAHRLSPTGHRLSRTWRVDGIYAAGGRRDSPPQRRRVAHLPGSGQRRLTLISALAAILRCATRATACMEREGSCEQRAVAQDGLYGLRGTPGRDQSAAGDDET